jgi:hypothetical protein
MQRDLSGLTRELRKESCPQHVLEEVQRKISLKRSSTLRWRLAGGFAIVMAVLACGVSVWQWESGRNIRRQAEQAESERLRVANEARDALEVVGGVLRDAGAHSEKIISDRAVPPLRNSFEIAKNKIIKNNEL